MQPAQYAAHHRLLLYATHNRQTTIAHRTTKPAAPPADDTHTPDQKQRTQHVQIHTRQTKLAYLEVTANQADRRRN